jgi:GMP synthase (glutamine-hydrolysing)
MKPLIIKTGDSLPALTSAVGDFEHWFLRGMDLEAGQVRIIDVARSQPLPEPGEVSGALVTGSPAMVSHRAGWSEATAGWLARAAEVGIPLLGICYGHQLLARALGGEVGPNPRGPNLGTARVTLTQEAADDPLLHDLPSPLGLQVSHFEAVLSLPPGARRLARCEADPNHAFVLGERTWGLQFHPEFDAHIMRTYIEAKSPLLREAGQDPDALRSAVEDTPFGPRILRRFAALVSG